MAYLSAFFNSSLFKYCFRDAFPELLGGTRELSKIFFDKIPVMQVSDEIDAKFSLMVDDIQKAYTVEKAKAIDRAIFELYNLTEDEIKHIGFIDYHDKPTEEPEEKPKKVSKTKSTKVKPAHTPSSTSDDDEEYLD